MHNSFFLGTLITGGVASLFFGFMYTLSALLGLFKVSPFPLVAQRCFGSFKLKEKCLLFTLFVFVIFTVTVATEYLMVGNANPYLMAFYGSLLLFYLFYPLLFTAFLKEDFWYKDLSMFWFFLIVHSIYWWMLVAYYSINIKFG